MTVKHKMHCPVCYMDIKENNITSEFQKMQFFFCSKQCQDRFLANPHLYIGHRGRSSAKQRGEHIIKQRIIKLEQSVPDDIAKIISNGLNDMMGIKQVSIKGERISICYDLLEATAKQIENKIELLGEHLKDNWVEHLKLAFIHYTEETEIDNLEQDTCSPHDHHH